MHRTRAAGRWTGSGVFGSPVDSADDHPPTGVVTKVSVVSHDLADNCLGRAYILAKALARSFTVEIVGPSSTGEIWRPVRDDRSVPFVITRRGRTSKAIDGDLVYAVKPRGTSFGAALLAQRARGMPIILDIDDWEVGGFLDGNPWHTTRRVASSLLLPWDTNRFLWTLGFEHLRDRAALITVSNRFLQRRFGGELVPHFRDTATFDPAVYDAASLKQRYGLADRRVVLFLGTPRPHKGLGTLVEAFDRLNRPDATLLVVGATDLDRATIPSRPYLRVLGQQPFSEIPAFLALADLIVLCQRTESKFAAGQLPAKLFDAMAMAKPIVASDMNDLPIILDGCGLVVDPNNLDDLVSSMRKLLDDETAAASLGARARQRCLAEYSEDVYADRLRDMVNGVLSNTTNTVTT
jgi:glycosyltransferase involved in cell wall biosynthesis